MLLKLELREPTVRDMFGDKYKSRWMDVISHCMNSTHVHNHSDLLYDVLLVFALYKYKKDKKDGDDFVSSMEAFVSSSDDNKVGISRAEKLNTSYLSIAKGMALFACDHYEECVDIMCPHLSNIEVIYVNYFITFNYSYFAHSVGKRRYVCTY